MYLSLSSSHAGNACAIRQSIINYTTPSNETQFFDWLVTSMKSVNQILENSQIIFESNYIYPNDLNTTSINFKNFDLLISHHDIHEFNEDSINEITKKKGINFKALHNYSKRQDLKKQRALARAALKHGKDPLKLLQKQNTSESITDTPIIKYKCSFCNKGYIRQKPYLKHQAKCNINSLMTIPPTTNTTQIITNNNTQNNTHNITNNNINNKFNIQIFLNEQCKDAINIKDFIESIKITLQQLEQIQNKGLVEGLATAILENIGRLSLYERPIHCTDIKRETLYIKHDDIWEKDETKQNIKKAIKELSHKPYSTLKEWLDNNPNYMDDENKQHFFIQTTRSLGKKCDTIDDKVIKNICSKTYIKDA